jgi:hypothetical protein
MSKERSCIFCRKWMSCEHVTKVDAVWNMPPGDRDLKWMEIAFECQEFE